MGKSSLAFLKDKNTDFHNILDSVLLQKPGENNLPTSDPGVAGDLFVTQSSGFQSALGVNSSITGSGFSLLCVSQG
tara:strand:- start:265 stop:492 length:228 start_codon:yes stop_codon:yes gene_type:complete